MEGRENNTEARKKHASPSLPHRPSRSTAFPPRPCRAPRETEAPSLLTPDSCWIGHLRTAVLSVDRCVCLKKNNRLPTNLSPLVGPGSAGKTAHRIHTYANPLGPAR